MARRRPDAPGVQRPGEVQGEPPGRCHIRGGSDIGAGRGKRCASHQGLRAGGCRMSRPATTRGSDPNSDRAAGNGSIPPAAVPTHLPPPAVCGSHRSVTAHCRFPVQQRDTASAASTVRSGFRLSTQEMGWTRLCGAASPQWTEGPKAPSQDNQHQKCDHHLAASDRTDMVGRGAPTMLRGVVGFERGAGPFLAVRVRALACGAPEHGHVGPLPSSVGRRTLRTWACWWTGRPPTRRVGGR